MVPGTNDARHIAVPVTRKETREILGLMVQVQAAESAITRASIVPNDRMSASGVEVRMLLYLARQGEKAVSMSTIANGIGASLGWGSRAAKALFDAGMIERTASENDRRLVQLKLNAQGRETAARLWQVMGPSILGGIGRDFTHAAAHSCAVSQGLKVRPRTAQGRAGCWGRGQSEDSAQ